MQAAYYRWNFWRNYVPIPFGSAAIPHPICIYAYESESENSEVVDVELCCPPSLLALNRLIEIISKLIKRSPLAIVLAEREHRRPTNGVSRSYRHRENGTPCVQLLESPS